MVRYNNKLMTKVLLISLFISVLVLYFPALNTYFSQDDFFHFKASQTDGSLKAFINLFGFPTFEERGYGFYRPLFREGLYNLYFLSFGLNHLPFRILQFVIHFLNIILVYQLNQKLFKNKFLSILVSLFFGISAANIALFYYLAGGIQVMGVTLFTLLTLNLYWGYLETGLIWKKILAFITFLLALASHELSATIPAMLAVILWLKFPLKKALLLVISDLWPFFLLLAIYLYLDIAVIGFSHSETQYQLNFSVKRIFNTFSWYVVWAIGVPEMLLDFLEPSFKLNPNLLKYWGNFFRIIFPSFLISLSIITSLLIFTLLRNKTFLKKQFFLFALIFLISLSPVLLLPLHKSTYYLSIGLWSFWILVGLILVKSFKPLVAILIITLIILNVTSIKLGEQTHWAASRGRLAQKILNQVKATYPALPKGAIVYFLNDPTYPYVAKDWGGSSKQVSVVLNDQDGLQLFYNDPTIKIYYEDLNKLSKDKFMEAFKIIAKLK